MFSRRFGRKSWHRPLGMGFLILSLVHTPLPRADFHNIRHHDGPGEVCWFHDHLLTWHPDARMADDVAVLHWHWFLPSPGPDRPTGEQGAVNSRVPDWSGLSWNEGPQLSPQTGARFVGRAALEQAALAPAPLSTALSLVPVRAGPGWWHALSATFAPRISLTSLLSRWIC
jgi:hypothetical protein